MITTTTENRVFANDETRFLSIWTDESEEQTRAILKAQLHSSTMPEKTPALRAIREAVQILRGLHPIFEIPSWFDSVVDHVPTNVRSRRDWPRFLSLCKAVCLTRRHDSGRFKENSVQLELADYGVAYSILADAFSRTIRTTGSNQISQVVEAVKNIYANKRVPVSANQLKETLPWKASTVYKFISRAEELGLIEFEKSSRPNNEKRLVPSEEKPSQFLPSPQRILELHPELKGAKYIDPITQKMMAIART